MRGGSEIGWPGGFKARVLARLAHTLHPLRFDMDMTRAAGANASAVSLDPFEILDYGRLHDRVLHCVDDDSFALGSNKGNF